MFFWYNYLTILYNYSCNTVQIKKTDNELMMQQEKELHEMRKKLAAVQLQEAEELAAIRIKTAKNYKRKRKQKLNWHNYNWKNTYLILSVKKSKMLTLT